MTVEQKYTMDQDEIMDERMEKNGKTFENNKGFDRRDTSGEHGAKDGQGTEYCRVRRVGSVTFGIALICYGGLFLAHMFMPVLRYDVIFRCWPVIFILLGIEILVENHKTRTKYWKMVYDFAAILMLGTMLLFAMVMGAMDYVMAHGYGYVCF